jgi:hypothetical protein
VYSGGIDSARTDEKSLATGLQLLQPGLATSSRRRILGGAKAIVGKFVTVKASKNLIVQ